MKHIILLFFCCGLMNFSFAQQNKSTQKDTFFLAKKKGILGRIGKSLHKNAEEPVKPRLTVEEFKPFHGKTIRHILIKPVAFDEKLGDTTKRKKGNFFTRAANAFHLNSNEDLIKKNLFFKEGQVFYPLQVADNERYLRTIDFLRDAIIKVEPVEGSENEIDVLVFTRDVFSIGGSLSASGADRVAVEMVEESFGGSGNRLTLSTLYDKDRSPNMGYGGEYMLRNINGSFVNWANGFKSFNRAFNSGRREEVTIYSKVEKPMASRYTGTIGAFELSYNKTNNNYVSDSLYSTDYEYSFLNTDLWVGYNFGATRAKRKDDPNHLQHFAAARTFFSQFFNVPNKYNNTYNYQYADINGVLLSYSIYKQNFYRTNFIYGFGRNEDVPKGLKASLIGGFTNKQGDRRAYYGTEAEWSFFNKAGCLYSYTLRTGGFVGKDGFEDIDLLLNINHFSKLFTLSKHWLNRSYLTVNYTRQINARLNEPLFLDSDFGLPYYRRGVLEGKMRAAIKGESVFYHMQKFLAFRFAPFVFADLGILQEVGKPYSKTNGYPVLGAGIRTRNENLVLGTMELKGFYIPRPIDGMKGWRVEVGTNLRFRYNSNFIRKPDFVSPN